MKVLHLNTFDSEGGASRTAYRIIQGLRSLGVDCPMLVNTKKTDDPQVIGPDDAIGKALATLRYFVDPLPVLLYRKRQRTLYPGWLADKLAKKVDKINPDIVHLHWILGGFLRIETLAKFNRPIVWTLHDMWAITGGCNFSDDCKKYLTLCGACPQLNSKKEHDLSRRVMLRKMQAWKGLDITFATYASWLAEDAKKSPLLDGRKIKLIITGLDTDRYQPVEKSIARKLLGLPLDKKLVMFGALLMTEPNKGFQFLQPALKSLLKSDHKNEIELAIFGSSFPPSALDLNTRCHFLGRLYDDASLALAYSAADVFVAPSMCDTGPQTVAEAMSCGTPVVGFRAAGLPDRIDHKKNGYIAQPFEIEDLAQGISWVLEDKDRRQQLSANARQKAINDFGLKKQGQAYLDLYESILGKI